MRVFVVIASLVVLASADVSHLFNGEKTIVEKTVTAAPVTSYGANYGSISYSDPIVNYVPTTTHTATNYVKPAVVSTTRYVAPAVTTSYVQQPVVTRTFVQQAPVVQTFNRYADVVVPTAGYTTQYTGGLNTLATGYTGGLQTRGLNTISVAQQIAGYGGAFYDSEASVGGHRTTIIKQNAPIVSKSTYVFSAPEDHEEQRDQEVILPRPKEHYNVVFVKTPSSTVINTPTAALAGTTKEKTLIYVLNDKKRIENTVDLPDVEQTRPQKPEVFFVKYNKPTEVRNSQVRYEAVDAIAGAENGAVNGVANRVAPISLQDEASSSAAQAGVASGIFNVVRNQVNSFTGIQEGAATADRILGTGSSLGSRFVNAASGAIGGATGVVNEEVTYTANGFVHPSIAVRPTIAVAHPTYATQYVEEKTVTAAPAYSTQYVNPTQYVEEKTITSGPQYSAQYVNPTQYVEEKTVTVDYNGDNQHEEEGHSEYGVSSTTEQYDYEQEQH